MFMSSIYTESLFAALSFYGMLWFVRGHYLPASLIWGIASAVRSNAIVYAGFFIYNILTGRTRGLTVSVVLENVYPWKSRYLKKKRTLLEPVQDTYLQLYHDVRVCYIPIPWISDILQVHGTPLVQQHHPFALQLCPKGILVSEDRAPPQCKKNVLLI